MEILKELQDTFFLQHRLHLENAYVVTKSAGVWEAHITLQNDDGHRANFKTLVYATQIDEWNSLSSFDKRREICEYVVEMEGKSIFKWLSEVDEE